jgi:hypothetical protein
MDDNRVPVLRLTAFPPGYGPYERWELTVEETGEVLANGPAPPDAEIIGVAADAYRARVRRGFGV